MKKRLLLSVSIIAILIFLVIFYFNMYDALEQARSTTPRLGPRMPLPFEMPIPFEYRMWLSPLLLVIAIVPISYYLISKKLEKSMKLMLKIVGKNNNIKSNKNSSDIINKDSILKLLNFNERKVLEGLIRRKGEVLQSEISQMDGMNKLKTHRAIKNLELKGVVKTENRGKTRLIILSKDIKNIMLK